MQYEVYDLINNRSRRRRQRRTAAIIVTIIIVAALALGAMFLLNRCAKDDEAGASTDGGGTLSSGAADWDTGDGAEVEVEEGGAEASASGKDDEADGKPSDDEAEEAEAVGGPGEYAGIWYYEDELAARYRSFATLHPDIPLADVVWMVYVDLDKEPYTQPQQVENPNDILLLVNKHFVLPESYQPADLVGVGDGRASMRSEPAAALKKMIDDAYTQGLTIWGQSGFRTYSLQVQLYNDYSARDGQAAADTYSARPGHSEHQTGLTMDLNSITDAFGDTAEGKWVAEHCYEYGFIVRYTKENTDVTLYKPEPWHLRYIGPEAAQEMHDLGIESFEEYWVKYVAHTPPAGETASASEGADSDENASADGTGASRGAVG